MHYQLTLVGRLVPKNIKTCTKGCSRMNKFIFDELTRTPTILAINRIHRPDGTGVVTNKNVSAQKVDLFAKGNEHLTPDTLYKDTDDWNVRVFANKYPIIDNHEIIVHSPEAEKDLEDLD